MSQTKAGQIEPLFKCPFCKAPFPAEELRSHLCPVIRDGRNHPRRLLPQQIDRILRLAEKKNA